MIITLTGADFSSNHIGLTNTSIDLTSSATENTGVYIYSGATTTSSYFVTKIVDVSMYRGMMADFTFVKYTMGSGGQAQYACGFSNTNNEFTPILRAETSSLGNTKGELQFVSNIIIPNDAKYIYIPWFNQNAVSTGVYAGSVNDFSIKVKNAVTTGGSDISSLFSFTSGSAIQGLNGDEFTSGVFAMSNAVDISGARRLNISFMNWTSSSGTTVSFGYSLYDSNMNHISGANFKKADSSLGNSAGVSTRVDVYIPSNAKYIRTTYHKDTATYGAFSATKYVL